MPWEHSVEGAGHATRWAPSTRPLPPPWTRSLYIHHFVLLPHPWVVQDGQTSAGPVAKERGRPRGGQGFKSPTKSPDCKPQPYRGQEKRSPALPREHSVSPAQGPPDKYPGAPQTLQLGQFQKQATELCVWSTLQLSLNQCSVGGEKVPGWWLPLGGRITGDLKFIFSPIL